MRSLLLALCLAIPLVPVAARANHCTAACRDKARACKSRCKAAHPSFGDPRHSCLKSCETREHECRGNC